MNFEEALRGKHIIALRDQFNAILKKKPARIEDSAGQPPYIAAQRHEAAEQAVLSVSETGAAHKTIAIDIRNLQYHDSTPRIKDVIDYEFRAKMK